MMARFQNVFWWLLQTVVLLWRMFLWFIITAVKQLVLNAADING